MNIKKADLRYISKETEDFLGLKFELATLPYGTVKTTKQNTKVSLIYQPDWNKWLEAMYYTAFTTWNNGFEIDLDKINAEKRKVLTLKFLKQRPISAVLESAVFVIKLDNVPRSMTHQIVRHRGMSFNQESYRVTPAHHADFRLPEGLDVQQTTKVAEAINSMRTLYLNLIADGVPIEQARNVLPMGTCTHIVMTANLKVLIDYVKARTLEIAQDEHTYIVMMICKELKTKAPEFYKHFISSERTEALMSSYGVE